MVATGETSTTRIIPTCNSRASIYPRKGQINNYAKTYINVNKSEGKWDQLPTAETSVLVWLDKGLNTISFTESCRYNGPNIDKVEIHETDQTMEKPDIEKPYPESCKEIDEYKM